MEIRIKECADKLLGCLYGQAIGDALGLGTEFMDKTEIHEAYPYGLSKYEDIMQDAHRKRWHKGAWTDDTDMMIYIMKAYENHHVSLILKRLHRISKIGLMGIHWA